MKNEKCTENTRLSEQLAEVPEMFLDTVMQQLRLNTDAALARALDVAPPVISKIRNKRIPAGYAVLVRALEATDLTMRQLYELSTDTSQRESGNVIIKMRSAGGKLRPQRVMVETVKRNA